MLVCLVFGEIVFAVPISGGIYPWRVASFGKRWAWMAGWIYGWALFVTLAAIATGAAPFIAQLIAIEVPRPVDGDCGRLIAITTILNLSGTGCWRASRCSDSSAS